MTRLRTISTGRPRFARAWADLARCLSLNASRLASAAARSWAFDASGRWSDMPRHIPLSSPARAGDPVFQSTQARTALPRRTGYSAGACHRARRRRDPVAEHDGNADRRAATSNDKQKCEAADAVEALDPGGPYESRWAPYVRAHGPGQGQFPKGSIRPRGYMAPDAQHSFASPM